MASSSCKKCVSVLRELMLGLQETKGGGSEPNSKGAVPANESPPLTLLKAIARGQQQDHHQQQRGGQGQQQNGDITRRQSRRPPQQSLLVEEVDDGVRLTIPVETTVPTLLRRWTKLVQDHHGRNGMGHAHNGANNNNVDDENNLLPLHHALATSASPDESQQPPHSHGRAADPHRPLTEPLVMELKCRKCASTGPEGGARAFLMGPQPLSVVLCHNRIASHKDEIEEILTHELVHLYDVQTMQLDLQDCENLAYSEVRAAKAAECRDSWKQLQPYCVKQKAICATNNLFPTEGRRCIQRVFDTAFADNRPFDGRQPNPSTNTHGGAASAGATAAAATGATDGLGGHGMRHR